MPDHPERPERATGQGDRRATAPGRPVHQPSGHAESRSGLGGHPHGKPSSWVLIGVVVAAFTCGGAALITHLWWLLWVCAGIIVLSIPVAKAIGVMDDTVA